MNKRLPRWLWDDIGLTMWGFLVLITTLLIVIAGVVVGASIAVESRNCAYASHQFGKRTHYDWLSTCWVRVGDQWVPRDRYQTFRQVQR